MKYHKMSDKHFAEFKAICEKEGIKYETEAECRDAEQNLIGLVDVLIQSEFEERQRKARLEKEPKGFAMAGEGRNCSLCKQTVYNKDGWYDKWGFKCPACQNAVSKRIVPGSLCRDHDNEKYITESSLAWKTDLHTQTIRKLIRQGKIKARQIPKGASIILRKDNPNISDILGEEMELQASKRKPSK